MNQDSTIRITIEEHYTLEEHLRITQFYAKRIEWYRTFLEKALERLAASGDKQFSFWYEFYSVMSEYPRISDAAMRLMTAGEYIYIIRDKEKGTHYKIGKTTRLKNRLDNHTKMPFEYEVVAIFEVHNCTSVERDLHAAFKKKHVNGEWFALWITDILKAITIATPERVYIGEAFDKTLDDTIKNVLAA